MPLENGRWRVVRGDCMWEIARAVYGDGRQWPVIADANGVPRSNPVIYPNQIFDLPGITPDPTPEPTPPAPAPAPVTISKVNIDWFVLTAGTQNSIDCIWSWSRSPNMYFVRWEAYDTNGNKWIVSDSTYDATNMTPQKRQTFDLSLYKKARVSIRPIKNMNGSTITTVEYQDNTDWAVMEYDFKNNPPNLVGDPEFTIDNNNKLTATIENIDSEELNANQIEFEIYQDNTKKYKTAKVKINTTMNRVEYQLTVDAGHTYRIRCRAVRDKINGGWTAFTASQQSLPSAPNNIIKLQTQKIVEQASTRYAVYVEWDAVNTAKQYEIQWTTNKSYFDVSGEVSSAITEEGQGPKYLVTDIDVGREYFFRVRSINDKGHSAKWTPIKSIILGTKPSAPTTWSNVTNAILGEDINIYWKHNATDGSVETHARICFTVINSNPQINPMTFYQVIENTRDIEHKEDNGVYTINSNSQTSGSPYDWRNLRDGFVIKYKIQTTGVANEYSDYSTERQIHVYSQPSVVVDILNNNVHPTSIEEVTSFPFYFSILAQPATQEPISYYIEVISNDTYSTVDEIGKTKIVNAGDKIYQKYYDPNRNKWNFLIEMNPGNIDLENNKHYTVNVTVAMNSGLTASSSEDFTASLVDVHYDVFGSILIDKETLTASICPYCNQYHETNGELVPSLVQNCSLSVYRRDFDGTFTLIEDNIPNNARTYVSDPHVSLDYARYRVVARMNDTGAISFGDIPAVYVGEHSIVIQWSEEWSSFEYDNTGEGNVAPNWAGSMLKLPYNVNISENTNSDVEFIEYAGRKHPVSYYGTQLGYSATWNTEIPAEDKDLLYQLRRLAVWMDNVYVREPSGSGYLANIKVSFSKTYNKLVIPVTLTLKRVEEGGN